MKILDHFQSRPVDPAAPSRNGIVGSTRSAMSGWMADALKLSKPRDSSPTASSTGRRHAWIERLEEFAGRTPRSLSFDFTGSDRELPESAQHFVAASRGRFLDELARQKELRQQASRPTPYRSTSPAPPPAELSGIQGLASKNHVDMELPNAEIPRPRLPRKSEKRGLATAVVAGTLPIGEPPRITTRSPARFDQTRVSEPMNPFAAPARQLRPPSNECPPV